MSAPYKPDIPQTAGEIIDKLGWMMLYSPKFDNDSGYFPGRNLNTTFFSLNEGLAAIRNRLGDERYADLRAMSDRMRGHFEADPENKTDDTLAGRALILEMMGLLKARGRRKSESALNAAATGSAPLKGK